MREILFRGKRLNNGEWIYGDLLRQYGATEIYVSTDTLGEYDLPNYHIAPESAGQFTGSTDKNGKKIFEGDIIRYTANATYLGKFLTCIGQVKFNKTTASYAVEGKDNIGARTYDYFPIKCEVIGNIHDNKELLEE